MIINSKLIKNKRLKQCLFFLFFLIIILRPGIYIYQNKESFFSAGFMQNYEQLKKLYYSSQYVKKKDPGIIPDQALESFAAGAFLKGMNPILIVHDQPPLGRYIIALSIAVFDNASTVEFFLILISVLGLFLVAHSVLKNLFLAIIPVGIFINEPMFFDKFTYIPLLEPIQLSFIIFAIYFFTKGNYEKKYIPWFVLACTMLGFVISTRFFILGLVLLFTWVFYLLIILKDIRRFFTLLFLAPLSLVVLVASYTKTIQDGYSIREIFGIQKYIFFYHKSKFILPFSFWDLLLFNRWHTWWGNRAISSDSQWILLWPISMTLTFISIITSLFSKVQLSEAEKIIILWILGYSLMLSAGYTSTRYFLPLIPFLYIISISFVIKIIRVFYNQKNR